MKKLKQNKTMGIIVLGIILAGFIIVTSLPEREVYKSNNEIDYEEIYKVEGDVITVFIKTETVNRETTTNLIKEIQRKYGDSLSMVHIFDNTQDVKVGEKPNLAKIDPKASYTHGDKKVILDIGNGNYEEFVVE